MNDAELGRLADAVQTNCDIADAQHAGDMTLCIYLLQMREFYRWERGLPFGAALARDAVGAWIAAREDRWSALDGQAWLALPRGEAGGTDGTGFDAFDVDAVNAWLNPQGLHYGAGLVGVDRPVFFLAELAGRQQREGLEVHVSGRELARGLVAPPATLGSGDCGPIVLRQAALARWCWEKYEAYRLRPVVGSAFHAVVTAYGLEQDFEAGLQRCVAEQGETLVLHEIGEHRAGRLLGSPWGAMRMALPSRRADLHARAVRDHIADLSVTLPTLLDRGAAAAVHFWFANFDGVRQLLFPALDAAYADWVRGDGGAGLRRAAAAGVPHFTRLAQRALDLHAREGRAAGAAIESLLGAPAAVCAL
ncbi:MAG: hypothetical protein C0505_10100 [Leptothrix sp. (in: Bacteria)]|nr:hypothetical protein [Leptothrix sp. (in: b-proteobacteria)]